MNSGIFRRVWTGLLREFRDSPLRARMRVPRNAAVRAHFPAMYVCGAVLELPGRILFAPFRLSGTTIPKSVAREEGCRPGGCRAAADRAEIRSIGSKDPRGIVFRERAAA